MRNWENNVRKVVPYVPGEQPKRKDIIKLNTRDRYIQLCNKVTYENLYLISAT